MAKEILKRTEALEGHAKNTTPLLVLCVFCEDDRKQRQFGFLKTETQRACVRSTLWTQDEFGSPPFFWSGQRESGSRRRATDVARRGWKFRRHEVYVVQHT